MVLFFLTFNKKSLILAKKNHAFCMHGLLNILKINILGFELY